MRARDSFNTPSFAACSLDMRQRTMCAMYAIDLSRRTHNAYPACAPRVSGVGPARSAYVWRSSSVCIHASSSAHMFVHAQQCRRRQRIPIFLVRVAVRRACVTGALDGCYTYTATFCEGSLCIFCSYIM